MCGCACMCVCVCANGSVNIGERVTPVTNGQRGVEFVLENQWQERGQIRTHEFLEMRANIKLESEDRGTVYV